MCLTAQNKLAGNTVGICDELITLEISSPDVCDLTLIDLPGITRVPVQDQPEDIGDQVSVFQGGVGRIEAVFTCSVCSVRAGQ